jgi:DNA polymerase V
VLEIIRRLQRRFYKPGLAYKRAGVWLMDLARPGQLQADLFASAPESIGDETLMATVDAINRRFGRQTIGLAASGWRSKPQWGMRQVHLSRHYTTSLDDLPQAIC